MAIDHENPTVVAAGEIVADALVDLEPLFQPEMVLAFIAYDPMDPEKDLCITKGGSSGLLFAAQRIRSRDVGDES